SLLPSPSPFSPSSLPHASHPHSPSSAPASDTPAPIQPAHGLLPNDEPQQPMLGSMLHWGMLPQSSHSSGLLLATSNAPNVSHAMETAASRHQVIQFQQPLLPLQLALEVQAQNQPHLQLQHHPPTQPEQLRGQQQQRRKLPQQQTGLHPDQMHHLFKDFQLNLLASKTQKPPFHLQHQLEQLLRQQQQQQQQQQPHHPHHPHHQHHQHHHQQQPPDQPLNPKDTSPASHLSTASLVQILGRGKKGLFPWTTGNYNPAYLSAIPLPTSTDGQQMPQLPTSLDKPHWPGKPVDKP
ncbi:unnamed protein product, partial [Protopolystoma xenopodis]